MSSHDTKNPTGGVSMGHVIEPPNPVDACSFSKSFGVHLLPDYGPVCSVKRPVRTRMRGVVGAGGEIPPATRLAAFTGSSWQMLWRFIFDYSSFSDIQFGSRRQSSTARTRTIPSSMR